MTDRAPALRAVIEELIPAFHNTEQYANNPDSEPIMGGSKRHRPMRPQIATTPLG